MTKSNSLKKRLSKLRLEQLRALQRFDAKYGRLIPSALPRQHMRRALKLVRNVGWACAKKVRAAARNLPFDAQLELPFDGPIEQCLLSCYAQTVAALKRDGYLDSVACGH